MLYDTYTRGNARVNLEIRGPWSSESQPENTRHRVLEIMARIQRTLSILPDSHIPLFGTIRLTNRLRSGGGHNPEIPHIQLSYDCFDHGYNQRDHSYTLLHEMGHMVDKRLFNGSQRISALMTGFPQGCVAMLSRYHSGGTVGPSEHYADIYADYFFTRKGQLGGWDIHRRDGDGCPSCRGEPITRNGREVLDPRCINWRNSCNRRLGASALPLPSGRALTELRYRALTASWQSRDVLQPSTTSTTHDLGISPHAAKRGPQTPGRTTYYQPGDQFIWR